MTVPKTFFRVLTVATVICTQTAIFAGKTLPVQTILVGGTILTMDADGRVVTALAIHDGQILAAGSDEEIRKLAVGDTVVVELGGKTVIPGIIAAHCHAVGVARNVLRQPHVELLSISAVQRWIRARAQTVPAGEWIHVPRADITRLQERRHPTVDELDAGSTSHPVIFTAARKSALNSLGLKTIGVSKNEPSVPGGEVILDAAGRVRLISGANAHMKTFMPTESLYVPNSFERHCRTSIDTTMPLALPASLNVPAALTIFCCIGNCMQRRRSHCPHDPDLSFGISDGKGCGGVHTEAGNDDRRRRRLGSCGSAQDNC